MPTQHDLCIMQGIDQTGRGMVTFSYGDTPSVVRGPQKAVQTLCLLLMTERGSVAGDPEFGSTLLSDIKSGAIRSEPDLQAYFNLAVGQALTYLRSKRAADTAAGGPGPVPDDEDILSVELQSMSLVNDKAILSILLRTRGSSGTYQIPVTVATS